MAGLWLPRKYTPVMSGILPTQNGNVRVNIHQDEDGKLHREDEKVSDERHPYLAIGADRAESEHYDEVLREKNSHVQENRERVSDELIRQRMVDRLEQLENEIKGRKTFYMGS